jgi:glyoxylase-like metal-dependent hydrolase (beta-lactamase superfamily II)
LHGFIEGDHVLADGIKILSTPGHTPGHQSALIELPKSGPALLVADVGDLMENFNQEILPGQASDDAKALASIRKINRIRAERNATMFLCHDPNLIQTTRLAPGLLRLTARRASPKCNCRAHVAGSRHWHGNCSVVHRFNLKGV